MLVIQLKCLHKHKRVELVLNSCWNIFLLRNNLVAVQNSVAAKDKQKSIIQTCARCKYQMLY